MEKLIASFPREKKKPRNKSNRRYRVEYSLYGGYADEVKFYRSHIVAYLSMFFYCLVDSGGSAKLFDQRYMYY